MCPGADSMFSQLIRFALGYTLNGGLVRLAGIEFRICLKALTLC